MKESTIRFSKKVQDYILYRPHYPRSMYAFLAGEVRLTPGCPVADIGSGTGISSEGFLEQGCRVYAIEPNEPMRQAAEKLFGGQPGFISVSGIAEETGLPDCSVDLIFAGQAFHWFEVPRAKAEFRRILKPGGCVVLAWNDRKDDIPFLADYETLLQKHGTDYNDVNHRNTEAGGFGDFFTAETFRKRTFENPYLYDLPQLEGRLLSCSYIPEPGSKGFDPMMQELKEIFNKHQVNGKVPFDYVTRVYYGQV